ncbi:DUF6493 family protein [Rapidithrix thailandica]|uniref:DUF6493 family protein n=1 Tax=Rapidithrix thailandica TaxID=413964 RepID=A0AAW9SI60_9BACT
MTQLNQLTRLIEQEDAKALVPFLKSLESSEREHLKPFVKKLYKKYSEPLSASLTQRRILDMAALVCYTFSEFRNMVPRELIFNPQLEEVLEWRCPKWLDQYFTVQDPKGLDYEKMMRFAQKGWLQPNEALIASLMTGYALDLSDGNIFVFSAIDFTQFPETLQTHIWYIFYYETSVHQTDSSLEYREEQMKLIGMTWKQALCHYSEQGVLDRQRLLQESLLVTTRNFNKNLTNWFIDLFLYLKPSQKELLSLQPALNQVFQSPHSKPIKTVFDIFKNLLEEKDFQLEAFLEQVPFLIASDIKVRVSSTLTLLEKLIKKYPDQASEICMFVAPVFIHPDKTLQNKAVKFILKHGNPGEERLQQNLMQYYDTLLSSSKENLQAYMPEEMSEIMSVTMGEPEMFESLTLLTEANEIQPPGTFDDLLFLASQSMEGKEVEHFDQLLSALIRLQTNITEETANKFEPVLQQAYKIVLNGFRSPKGHLDELVAHFWVDFGQYLIEKYPEGTQPLLKLHKRYQKKDEQNIKEWKYLYAKLKSTKQLDESYSPCLNIIQYKLLLVFEKLKTGDTLPILSTPTHSPAWLSPVALVQRLAKYQEAQIPPNGIDLQLAISRVVFEQQEEALQLAQEKLNGEELSLIRFLLNSKESPKEPFTQTSAWMMAGVRKEPETVFKEFDDFLEQQTPRSLFTGNFPWEIRSEKNRYSSYGPTDIQYIHLDLKCIHQDVHRWREETDIKFDNFVLQRPEKGFLLSNLYVGNEYVNDISRLFSLVPFTWQAYMIELLPKNLKYSSFVGEDAKKCTQKVLETLLMYPGEFNPVSNLYVAASMLCSDKTAKSLAAEVWIQSVREQKIQSEELGTTLGQLIKKEYGPLKRFTDLLSGSLYQVSSLHNQALEKLLIAFLLELPEEPVKGLKKLLEQFVELVVTNQLTMNRPELVQKLQQWKQTHNLKKVILSLEKLCSGK